MPDGAVSPHPGCPVGHHPPEHPCEYPDCRCFSASRRITRLLRPPKKMSAAERFVAENPPVWGCPNQRGCNPLDRPMNELRDSLLAAAQRQENTMNTAGDVRSLLSIPEGGRFVIVDYRDNSDHGRAREFYDDERDARARSAALIEDPPGGNYFHPAPADLDVRIYAVERLPVGSTEKWGGTFVPGDGGYRPGHATDCSCDACARDSQRDYPEGG